MVSVVLLPGVLSLGASASVFGLVGATWADVILNHLARGRIHDSGIIGLIFITIVNLLIGLTPWVDNFMHLGGLVAGLLIGLMLFSKKHVSRRSGRLSFTRWQIVIVLVGSTLVAVRCRASLPA
jgi:membrane associated rhomboid family serine protease